MYAIVEIGGQQHKVEKDQRLYVNRLEAVEGSNLEFEKVMLTDKDGAVAIGLPFVEGVRVAARVVAHVKDDKVHIFKHKRRKGYRRFNGHRQPLTELWIQGILAKGETITVEPEAKPKKEKSAAKKVATKKKASEEKAEEPKAEKKTAKTTTKKKSKKDE